MSSRRMLMFDSVEKESVMLMEHRMMLPVPGLNRIG